MEWEEEWGGTLKRSSCHMSSLGPRSKAVAFELVSGLPQTCCPYYGNCSFLIKPTMELVFISRKLVSWLSFLVLLRYLLHIFLILIFFFIFVIFFVFFIGWIFLRRRWVNTANNIAEFKIVRAWESTRFAPRLWTVWPAVIRTSLAIPVDLQWSPFQPSAGPKILPTGIRQWWASNFARVPL